MFKNQKVLVVVNPISGGIDKETYLHHIIRGVEAQEGELHTYKTTGKRDKEELYEVVEWFNPDRVLIVGGDGTIKLMSEVLEDSSIPLGIFPAGSANGLAENLNLPDDPAELTRIALSDNFKILDSIRVNNELCLHIGDIGLNAALIKNYEEGNIRGKLGYIIQSIPTLIKTDFPFQFKIEIQGRTIHRKAVLVAIANARRYGTGSTINPNGRYDDGKFEILVFKQFDIPEILKTFREHVSLSKDFLEIFPASEAHIECSRNVPFQVDGEYRGEVKTVHAKISSIKIKIAVPAKKPISHVSPRD